MSGGHQFELAQNPSDAISAVKFSPYDPNRLLVSSWDKGVYLYDIHGGPGGKQLNKFEHRAPVLDVCFGRDDKEAFSCGLDWDVRRIDLESGEQTVMSSHKAGVRNVIYSPENNILISGSWDSTLHIHDLANSSSVPATVNLPSKPYTLSITKTKLVVGMASRAVVIYDLASLASAVQKSSATEPPNVVEVEPLQTRESSMKFMTRSVACMPNDAGYASSSIEGRVAVEWFDPSAESQSRKYAFKCHRQQVNGEDVVYPVNALAFHPIHGTFASGGGDGVLALWDGVAKRRIRQYQKYPASVSCLSFSNDGKYIAVGVSPGFEDGKEDISEGVIKVFIRELAEGEAAGKRQK